jgi:serine/threonine-protein kinase RsbT
MAVVKHDTRTVRASEDVVGVRRIVREWSISCGFSLVDQTKMVTAASELARNAVLYGGGGTVRLEALNDGARRGLRLVFEDHGRIGRRQARGMASRRARARPRPAVRGLVNEFNRFASGGLGCPSRDGSD